MARLRAVPALLTVVGALLLGTTGCRSLAGPGGLWADDQSIATKVKARLAPLRGSSGTRINVESYGGTVYLTGVVDSEELKHQAEALAWGVEQVRQVVPNLGVRDSGPGPAASPVTDRAHGPGPLLPSPPLLNVRGLARVEPSSPARHGPFRAYDATGRQVATIYTISMREMASDGLDGLRVDGPGITLVSIYPAPAHPEVPEPHYHVVLWHVSPREAAALR